MSETNRNLLADGRVLCSLKNLFREEPTRENLDVVLACLAKAEVFVPMIIEGSSSDASALHQLSGDQTIALEESVHMRPDILRSSGGDLYFPMFTMETEIPQDYRRRFTFVSMPAVQCISTASASTQLRGMILDPFSGAMEIPMENAIQTVNLAKETNKPQA